MKHLENPSLLGAPAHPLCLLATVLLLLNDHLLKAMFHNAWTGKISDVCWLIVAPVVLAALLHRMGVAVRKAQAVALLSVGAFFIALQLWHPLGDALVGWYGGSHVADPSDLFALPALLLAAACWRRTRPIRPLAFGLSLVACVATAPPETSPPDHRYPCDGEPAWDPSTPLYIQFADEDFIPVDTPAFRSNIRLYKADGGTVEVFYGEAGSGGAVICPKGGLDPGEDYVWHVGSDFSTDSHNTLKIYDFGRPGTWAFTTDDNADNAPINSAAACWVHADVYSALSCDDDTGDSGGNR